MTAAITTLRASLAAALDNPSEWNTYSFPPATITANSVIVAPSTDGYITPSNNSYATIAPLANFKIIMTVPMFDNQGNLQGIESLAVAVFNKLAASSIQLNVGAMSAPSVLEVQSGSLLTADFSISVLTSWS
jgi:hypothetical protein